MKQMIINVPDEMVEHVPTLQYFMQTMVNKLHLNRHKGFGESLDLVGVFAGLSGEHGELRHALASESQFQAYIEAVDVANFAMLAGMVVLRMDKKQYADSQGAFSQHWGSNVRTGWCDANGPCDPPVDGGN
jgi:hypothetical protein